jgi:hypothetical protein
LRVVSIKLRRLTEAAAHNRCHNKEDDMKKALLFLLLLVLVMALVGCSSISGIGDGRMEAWKAVKVAEETTKQSFLETKRVELSVQRVGEQNPTLKLSSYDAVGTKTAEAEMDLQPLFAELGLGKDDSTYGVKLDSTPLPTGQIAETIGAAGSAVVGAAQTPTSVVLAAAYGMGRGIKEAGGGSTNLHAENMDIDSSFNKADASAVGGNATATVGSTSGAAGEEKVDPVVVSEADFAFCTAGDPPPTLGQAGTCLKLKGYDIKIEGGLAIVGGVEYGPLNDWEAAK